MHIIQTEEFERSLSKLPIYVRRAYASRRNHIEQNLNDPQLHLKRLRGGLRGVFSVRVTRNYRALFYISEGNYIIFFDIDHRKDIYR